MLLDNRTLLLSLVLVCAMMAISLAVASWGREHDSLKKWGGAMALESLAFVLAALRGDVPDFFGILIMGILMVGAQSVKLAAIYEYREIPCPRLQCFTPVALAAVLLIALPYDDVRDRLVLGSLVYALQMLLIMQALRGDVESRTGRAWWLVFGATLAIIPVFLLRGVVAYFGVYQFSSPQSSIAPNPVQMAVFVGIIGLSLMGSMGFILMVKERAERAIRLLAMNDSLTGIFNRRAFMDRAEKEYAIARRNQAPMALLMLDIDHFKSINDEHGHSIGDDVLVGIVQILNSRLRKQDTLGRYGGEEFCITLPGTDADGAMALAESLRASVENTPLIVGGKKILATISIGVMACQATCTTCNVALRALFDSADAALYQAKREGRNRAVMLPVHCENNAERVGNGEGA
jgi:diguanylate cyclase (GGDEF)-like protein